MGRPRAHRLIVGQGTTELLCLPYLAGAKATTLADALVMLEFGREEGVSMNRSYDP